MLKKELSEKSLRVKFNNFIQSIFLFFKTKKKEKEFIEHELKEKQATIEDCNKRLNNIEENLKIPKHFHTEENRTKISVELIKVKKIGTNLNDFDLIKRVDEIQNELCSQHIKRFVS